MSTQHTAGPWVNLEDHGIIHAPSTDQAVCQVWNKFEDDFHNAKANARLISAAPELLQACRELLDIVEHISGGVWLEGKSAKAARAAITKATKPAFTEEDRRNAEDDKAHNMAHD